MKSTGIVRNLDNLGRVTLPIELRRSLDIDIKDPVEIFVDGDSIVLKKYQPVDIFTGSILGFYALLYMYVGYFNGFFRKMFYPEDIKLPMLLIAVSDFSCSLIIYFLLFLFRGKFDFLYYLLNIMIPELVYTMVVTIFLYFIILKINQKLEAIEKRSAVKFV